ncbi:helix-turn-helix domain-containing protein [Priestia megaterium]|uniref:helix-turn-helix domain-containing protein n=1 Tax=Priestia megaterium TaxID=1404 RepID=UPI00372D751C
MDIEQAFGIVIKKYRLESSISQEKLAFEAGLDRTYISLLERGKRKPTINTLFSISRVYKVSPHRIVSDIELLLQKNSETCP